MYLLILFLPFLSFSISFFLGRKIGINGSKFISILLLFFTFLLSFLSFIRGGNVDIYFFSWFNSGLLANNFSFFYDSVTLSMLFLVTFISFLVHIYSTSYMEFDPHLQRFLSYLSLFTFFMIVLLTADNLIQLFIGWEGVGLCSYLLVNFWYTRLQANKSAIKAMLVNKIGDIGLLLAIVFLWKNVGLTYYFHLFPLYNSLSLQNYLNIINILLLIGVIGKSAQIGLHMWLPDAMEGPTPVSALIHAATMVTAGVFLIIRTSPLFEQTPLILLLIVLIGSITCFFSASIGLTQSDLKKVIAYSTCSQLGYMVVICGFSYYDLSLFHLLNHGFFKALLFLSAGSIIHAVNDEQDIRKIGGVLQSIPFSYICMFIGSISLMGLPFLTGFYSKDLLLEVIYQQHYLSFSLWLGLGGAFMTAFYSFRLIFISFFSKPQYNIKLKIHEGNWNLILPLFILLVNSIILGFFLKGLILNDYKPIMLLNINKFSPLISGLLGSILSIYMGYFLIKTWKIKIIIHKVYHFIIKTWYFDQLISFFLVKPFLSYGFNFTYKVIDNQILEIFGPYKISKEFSSYSSLISNFHLGKITSYTFAFIIFIFILVFFE